MVVLIYSGNISALVSGEAVLSVNWPGRLECNLDYGEGRLGTGPRYPLIWKKDWSTYRPQSWVYLILFLYSLNCQSPLLWLLESYPSSSKAISSIRLFPMLQVETDLFLF